MKYPIRILHEGLTYRCGGTEAFVMNLYRNIDREKFQFDFVNSFDRPLMFSDEIESLGGRIYKIPSLPRYKRLEQIGLIKDLLDRRRSDFQILHCHFQTYYKNLYQIYASKLGFPVVVHFHSAIASTQKQSFANLFYQRTIEYRNNTYMKYADMFFACSELANKSNCNGSATVFKNAIDVNSFRYDSKTRVQVREELRLGDAFVVIFVGRIVSTKNPIFLLDVFKSIRDKNANSKLLIVGDGSMRNEVLQKIDVLGLQQDVVLLGVRHDVQRLLQGADAFLFPSQFEGFGIALLEAQTSGIPCFTSKTVVPSEVNVTGLVHFLSLEESPESWAAIVLASRCLDRKDYGDVLKSQGYDAQDNVKIMEEKYLELMRLKK